MIPPDNFVAMENWGSIRFSEAQFLYKKDFSSEEIVNDQILVLVTHEIVHMVRSDHHICFLAILHRAL